MQWESCDPRRLTIEEHVVLMMVKYIRWYFRDLEAVFFVFLHTSVALSSVLRVSRASPQFLVVEVVVIAVDIHTIEREIQSLVTQLFPSSVDHSKEFRGLDLTKTELTD